MTNQQAPVALRLAEELEHDPGINRPSVVAELRRLHAENTTLQQGYNAARMEIEGLRDRVQELGAMLRENCNRRIVELESMLAAVGAGGVEPLRPRKCLHQISEPAPAAQGDALPWLQANDMAALERFAETTDDDESYDIGKEAVQRLAGFGCLRSHGFGKYSITDFGHYVLNDWSLARELPFKSQSERDARSQAKEGGA